MSHRPSPPEPPDPIASARVAASVRAHGAPDGPVDHPPPAARVGDPTSLVAILRRPFTAAEPLSGLDGEVAPWMRFATPSGGDPGSGWPAGALAAARAAEQLVALQHATAALGSALTAEAIGDVVVGHVVALLGAAAGALAVVDPLTGAARVVRAVGRPAEGDAAGGGRLPAPDLRLPIAEAARSGRAVYLATVDGGEGAAALPCVAGGEVLGVVALGFLGPSTLADGERVLGEMLAAQCAQALSRVRLLDAQAQARDAAQAVARHLAQLQRLTERVSTALTTADVMRVVGEDVAGAVDGASAAVYAARPTDGRLELAAEFGDQQTCDTDEFVPGGTVVEAAALAAKAVAAERLLVHHSLTGTPDDPPATCVALPLGAGPGVVGAVVLELRPPRALTPAEQDLLLAAGRIAAQGITRARLQSLREEERRRLARELHDEFGQTLTGLTLDLAYLARQLAADGGARFAAGVVELAGRVDGAVDALRRIAAELRPGALDDLGLVTALEWQAGEFARRTGVPCAIAVDLEIEVGEPAATAVFRVFQEALTNVARHAGARRVEARLSDGDGRLRLRVVDDGVGLVADGGGRPGAMGLVGMRERAAALGGRFTVGPVPGGGTAVCLELPYAPPGPSASTAPLASSDARPEDTDAPAGRHAAAAGVFAPEPAPARPVLAVAPRRAGSRPAEVHPEATADP